MADEFCREQGYLQAGTARPFSLPAAMVAMVSLVLVWASCSWWGLRGDRCVVVLLPPSPLLPPLRKAV